MSVSETLIPVLKGLRANDTSVVDVRWDERDDSSGRPAVFIALVLADPPAGQETWPIEDVRRLKRTVRDELFEKDPDFDTPWFIELESEHPDELDAEDARARREVEVDAV